jgi:hypothetical protein
VKINVWVEIADELEESFDLLAAFIAPWKPEAVQIGISKALSSANISAAFFGSRNEEAVNSSRSCLAFFICSP